MLKSIPLLALVAVAGLSITGAQQAAFADTAEPASHSARYRLNLLEARVGEVTLLDGVMGFDVIKGCDAWTVQSQLEMAAGSSSGKSFEMDVDHVSREALDGRWLEFDTKFGANGGIEQAFVGHAEVKADGSGIAVFEQPEAKSIELPAGTTFPVQAVQRNIAQFWNGDTRLINYLYFDGSDLAVARATDLLAGDPDPLVEGLVDPDNLASGDNKRVVTTLFDLVQTDAEPRTTYIADTLPNGVITRLTIDLGFMVVEARLIEIVAIPEPKC